MSEEILILKGFVATNCGRTSIELSIDGSTRRATLGVFARWMGDEKELDVRFDCAHEPATEHYGMLSIEHARDAAGSEIPLPPADGALLVEYVRVPPQEAKVAGSDAMAMSGTWTARFTAVLWLHRDATFDRGTDLEPEEYETPPEEFKPAIQALEWLVGPWKLG